MPEKTSTVKIRKLEEMRGVLLDRDADGSEDVYLMIRGQPNITVLLPGKIGREFTKTYGHYHNDDRAETYKVLFGCGKMLIQNREAGDVQLLEMKVADEVVVPEGYAHTMINTGDTPLVTTDDAPADAEEDVNDYEPIKEKQGFALYVVEENGRTKTVPNPRYNKASGFATLTQGTPAQL